MFMHHVFIHSCLIQENLRDCLSKDFMRVAFAAKNASSLNVFTSARQTSKGYQGYAHLLHSRQPTGSQWVFAPCAALRHKNLFPHSPIFHEHALLPSCTLPAGRCSPVSSSWTDSARLPCSCSSVLDVILEDCAVDLHGLVVRVAREVVQTNSEAKCAHGGLARASSFTDTLGVNPTQDGLAKPCKVPCHCCDLSRWQFDVHDL